MRNGLAGSKDNMGDNGQNTVWTGDREEENGNEPLEVFSMKVMKVANGYADMVLLKIASFAQMADAQDAGQFQEFMSQVTEGIRMLNYIANTLERIGRIQGMSLTCGHGEKELED